MSPDCLRSKWKLDRIYPIFSSVLMSILFPRPILLFNWAILFQQNLRKKRIFIRLSFSRRRMKKLFQVSRTGLLLNGNVQITISRLNSGIRNRHKIFCERFFISKNWQWISKLRWFCGYQNFGPIPWESDFEIFDEFLKMRWWRSYAWLFDSQNRYISSFYSNGVSV